MSIEVSVALSKFIYESLDKKFKVIEFIDVNSAERLRASGNICLNSKRPPSHKQLYKLVGEWKNNPKYGKTFEVFYSEPEKPKNLDALEPFLISQIKGIGKTTAQKILSELDITTVEDLIEICTNNKEKLYRIFSKNKRKIADNIITLMNGDSVFRDIMIFLHEHEIPSHFANKIYDKYKDKAVSVLLENPYRLISDFRRVGFLKADNIAQKLGISRNSIFRFEAAFVHTLETAQDMGHVCLPRDDLLSKALSLLNPQGISSLTREVLLHALRTLYKKNLSLEKPSFKIRLIEETKETFFYLPETLEMEDDVASLLNKIIKSSQINTKVDSMTVNVLKEEDKWSHLSREQLDAVEMSLNSRVMILTGGPGCGKTFTLKALHWLLNFYKFKIVLCAPTGLAAKRMSASIGSQAYTIHKLLGLGKRDETQVEDPSSPVFLIKNSDVVIVDESSMISLSLMHKLLSSSQNKKIIFVGDVDQLPSVGAGNCLRDFIESKSIPLVRLTKIFRQGKDSPIPNIARDVIKGSVPSFNFVLESNKKLSSQEYSLFIKSSKEDAKIKLLNFFKNDCENFYKINPKTQCQVLVPVRKGDIGQDSINTCLQEALNPNKDKDKKEIKNSFGVLFREGDKVIQIKNNYDLDVFNGDLGFCERIVKTKEKTQVFIKFDKRVVCYEDEDIDELQLSYAMTIHKSQGSEFSMCIVFLFKSYYTMLDRNLLYTAITRAKQFLIIIGDEWALQKAVNTQNSIKRYSYLKNLI